MLTDQEKRLLLSILAIFLLGGIIKMWKQHGIPTSPAPLPEDAADFIPPSTSAP
jgi:hypothetical protein